MKVEVEHRNFMDKKKAGFKSNFNFVCLQIIESDNE